LHSLPFPRFPSKVRAGCASHAGPTPPIRVQVLECGPNLVANEEHFDLLRQGVDAWNKWRKKERSIVPDLRGAHLRGADLREAGPVWANLREAKLSGAELREADLTAADLYEAHLSRADLRRANLTGAYLREANLSQAPQRGGPQGANLSQAILSGADLTGADLTGATLLETDLVDAVLTGSRIYGISAWNVRLSDGTEQQNLIITDEDEQRSQLTTLRSRSSSTFCFTARRPKGSSRPLRQKLC
jgi:uncharacterized protein YjbI with pentapeptide repeats